MHTDEGGVKMRRTASWIALIGGGLGGLLAIIQSATSPGSGVSAVGWILTLAIFVMGITTLNSQGKSRAPGIALIVLGVLVPWFGVVSIAALPAIIGGILLIRDANRSNQ